MKFEIAETDRQMILVALALLAVERPGWTAALGKIAKNLDGKNQYDHLRLLRNGGTALEKLQRGITQAEKDGALMSHFCTSCRSTTYHW